MAAWCCLIAAVAVIPLGSIIVAALLRMRKSKPLPAIRPPIYTDDELGGMKRKLHSTSTPLYTVDEFLSAQERAHIIEVARPHLKRSAMALSDDKALKAGWQRALVLCLAEMVDHRVRSLPSSQCAPLLRRALSHPTVTLADAAALLAAASVDRDMDELLSQAELTDALRSQQEGSPRGFAAVAAFFDARPRLHLRYSETAWLEEVPGSAALRGTLAHRLSALTGDNFTDATWSGSSAQLNFQVVRYLAGGHYACHLDSGPLVAQRRILTLVAFLEGPEESGGDGGALVFPFARRLGHGQPPGAAAAGPVGSSADETRRHPLLSQLKDGGGRARGASTDAVTDADADVKTTRPAGEDPGKHALGQWLRGIEPTGFSPASSGNGSAGDRADTLVRHFLRKADAAEMATAASMSDDLTACWAMAPQAQGPQEILSRQDEEWGVHIAPEPGRAVLWYNHRFGDRRFFINEEHAEALHCGCTVRAGEKWILNIWPTFRR